MNAFALVLAHGPGWDPGRDIREQDGWDAHAAFMDSLVDSGLLLHGGPVGDRTRTLHLVEAEDEAAVRARIAQDPWARDGHLVVESVDPWDLWLDHRGGRNTPDEDEHADDTEAELTVETGRREQRLVISGWFASHADSGTPGPHVALRTSDGQQAVLRTDQVRTVIDALTAVAARIEGLWERDGDWYAENVVRRHPDPQDPRVSRQHERERLRFVQAVTEHLPGILDVLGESSSVREAENRLAVVLGVDETTVMRHLAQFDVLALIRPATERRLRILSEPQD